MIDRFPLVWPQGWRRITTRKRAAFTRHKNRLSVFDGIERVASELQMLGIGRDDWVVSTNIRTRLDGLPRSDQPEPEDPGAAAYWTDRDGKTKVMAVDLYDRVADNLAAIAATLEAMRAIERHGGAQILERAFTGFDALPAPESFDPWSVLGLKPGSPRESVDTAFRELAKRAHPDAPGGSHEAFLKLQRAREAAIR